MDNLIISRATMDDLQNILRLDSQYQFEQYSEDMIRSSIKNESYLNLIAKKDGVAVGYVSFLNVLQESELLKIVVDNNFRGFGIGRDLIKHAMDILKANGIEKIFLEVKMDNSIAKQLYKAIGFEKIHIRQKYYEDGGDAEIYSLSL